MPQHKENRQERIYFKLSKLNYTRRSLLREDDAFLMAFSAFGILFALFTLTFLLNMCVVPEGLAQDRSVLRVLGQPKPRSDISFTFSDLEFDGLGSGRLPRGSVYIFEEERL